MRLLNICLLSSALLISDSLNNHLSFQGFTGVINTPNAQVIDNGNAVIHFNNQFDNHLRDYNYDKSVDFEENYIFGIGFLPSLEIAGRVVEAKGYARDLSANIKYKIPYKGDYFPDIAIGIQDLGGAYSFYDNKYIVIDKKIGRFWASLGYGKAGDGVKGKRMNGLFGGLEIDITNGLSLIAENDNRENHAGVRLILPKFWFSNIKLDATLVQNLTNSDTSFGVNLSIPLLEKKQEYNILLKESNDKIFKKDKVYIKRQESVLSSLNKIKDNRNIDTLFKLQKQLAEFGFENVRVGTYGDRVIYVECENSIFDKNDIDALGYIIGTIVNSDLDYNYFTVTLLKNNIQTISLNGSIIPYQRYIKSPTPENYYKVKNTLLTSNNFDTSKVNFIAKKINSSRFIPRVEFSPGFITTVGTELGVFDYLASLRSNLYTNIYDGLIVSAMYEVPFAHSDDFENGEVYDLMYKDRSDSRLVNAGIHQSFHYNRLFNTTTIGIFETDYQGIYNQTYLSSKNGEHAIGFKIGTFKKDNGNNNINIYEGSYRYFYEPLELFGKLSYGEYWNSDSGVSFELKRFFGDTAISLEYRNLDNQYIGAKISFPLTPRKIANSSFGQIKGKSDFEYGLRTTINLDDGSNRLLPNGGKMIKSDFELTNYYLNRDRLNSSYILSHINRMREVYINYK
jgi:hypothetical protein